MNIFDEIHDRLSSKVKTRALFSDTHHEDLEKVITRLQGVLSEKLEARKKAVEEKQKKIADVESVKAVMSEMGLSVDDLAELGLDTKKRRVRNTQKHTFEYQADGETKLWHGSSAGRLPKEFQAYLNATGKKRVDCIVG